MCSAATSAHVSTGGTVGEELAKNKPKSEFDRWCEKQGGGDCDPYAFDKMEGEKAKRNGLMTAENKPEQPQSTCPAEAADVCAYHDKVRDFTKKVADGVAAAGDIGTGLVNPAKGAFDTYQMVKDTSAQDVVEGVKKVGEQAKEHPKETAAIILAVAASKGKLFKVAKHGDMPSPRPGMQSHHGVMSAWMKKHFSKYDPDKAPAVLMPEANHRATFGVYNKWRAEKRKEMGGTFDWGKVSEKDMKLLSEKMFDAAEVPADIRQQYWDWYSRMKSALKE